MLLEFAEFSIGPERVGSPHMFGDVKLQTLCLKITLLEKAVQMFEEVSRNGGVRGKRVVCEMVDFLFYHKR